METGRFLEKFHKKPKALIIKNFYYRKHFNNTNKQKQ